MGILGNAFAWWVILAALPIGAVLAMRFGIRTIYLNFIICAHLFLPQAAVDIPYFLPLEKGGIIGVFTALLIILNRREFNARYRTFAILLFLFGMGGTVVSHYLNGDPAISQSKYIAGVSVYDGFAAAVKWGLGALPFLAGIGLFYREADAEYFLKRMVLFGLIYGALILFEWRMSPQLHSWIYGFFQHQFIQHMRGGGFRPIVFMEHGLHVAFFAFLATCSLIILMRAHLAERGIITKAKLAYLGILVFLCKSFGSIIFLTVVAPFIWLASRKAMRNAAMVLAVIAITYPASRSTGIFPAEPLLETLTAINADRGASLGLRFRQEEAILDRTLERPIWGWAGYGRSRLVDTAGPVITDGLWVVIFGRRGWAGFLAVFGLLTLPIYLVWRAGMRREVPFTIAGIAMLLAINTVELLPNSTIGPWTWLMAGTLAGYALSRKEEEAAKEAKAAEEDKAQRRAARIGALQGEWSGDGRRTVI